MSSLTDTKLRALRAKDRPYKVGAGNGLYIYVTTKGAKHWRQKYRINSKEKLLSHGEYPFTSLKEARELRDEARAKIKKSIDPSLEKRDKKISTQNQFEAIARKWHEAQKENWSENHIQKVIVSLKKDIFPTLGDTPINKIDTPYF